MKTLITWHFDHSLGRSLKGVNIVSCLHQNTHHKQDVMIPISLQPIQKTERVFDKKKGKEVKKRKKTKNEYLREMARVAVVEHRVKCKWVVADTYVSGNDNMEYIRCDLKKDFVMPIKTNRLVCKTKQEKKKGVFQHVETRNRQEGIAEQIYIQELPFPVLLVKQVFRNEDGSSGILYLVCSDITVGGQTIMDVYQKRWPIEEYHKAITSNTALSKSPTRTQQNHFFSSIYAFFKLEVLKMQTKLNHFALKTKLYVQALKASMQELEKLQTNSFCVT